MTMGLGGRLTVWYVVAVTTALCILGGSLLWAVAGRLLDSTTQDAAQIARQAAALASSPNGSAQHLSLNDPGMIALAAGRRHVYLQVSSGSAVIQQSADLGSTRLPLEPPPPTALRWGGLPLVGLDAPIISLSAGQAVYAAAPVWDNGRPIGQVEAAVSLNTVDEAVRTLGQGLIRVGLSVLAVVVAITIFMTYRSYSRLRRLTRLVDQINSGRDLNRRIALSGPADEVLTLARAFNRMIDQLQESFRRQELIIAQASHQLRTPLSSALGYAQMLRRWGKAEPALVDEAVEVIHRQLTRLNATLETILRLAAVEGQEELVRTTVTVGGFFDAWRRRHPAGAVSVAGGPDAVGEWDGDLLFELFDILLANTELHAGSDRPPVITWTRAGDEALDIMFRDEGRGFDPAMLPDIFQPFVRTGPGFGSGLGLALAQEIARHHGGFVRAANVSPHGALVTVRLPVSKL